MKEVFKLNIEKSYILKHKVIPVFKDLKLNFESGKFYAIMGHSGCSKSTLINIMGLLDNEFKGEYFLNEKNVSKLSNTELANLRNKEIGFIFQEFLLDKYLKAYENVIFPMLVNKDILPKERKKRALELLNMLGLEDRVNHFPKELSGGEQQRVAIARALANNPNIILADEPTGDLDEENEAKIFNILKELSKKGKCVIVVSHSNEVKKYADIVYKLKDGKITEEKI